MTRDEKDATSLEDLLEGTLPSAALRRDGALATAGFADAEIAATKGAIAALGRTEAEAPPPALRGRILASARRPGKLGIFADRVSRLFDLPLAEAATLLAAVEEGSAWKPFLVDGLDAIPVVAGPRCAGAIATLVRIQPGGRFPDHAHRGVETTLVLDGGFREAGTASEVWRGEEIVREDGSEHALEGLPGQPCIAAVLIAGHADIK